MRIAIFDDLPEGGAKRVAFEHVRHLAADHTVYYFSNTLPTVFPFERHAHDVFRFDLNLWKVGGISRPFSEWSYEITYKIVYKKIARILAKLDVDVLIAHPSKLTQCPGITLMSPVPTIYFAEEWPRVVYEPEKHPLPPGLKGKYEAKRRQWIGELDRCAVAAATRVVTTSLYTAGRLKWAYGGEALPLSLGVDAGIFAPQVENRKHFLFIGEKEKINGYPLVSKIRDLPVKYLTFKKASFRLSDKQLAKAYSESIATLCLARNEPFGLVALESMACETPVIALAEGGYTETVISGKTGLLTASTRAAVETAMQVLANNPRLAARLGKAGRRRVKKQYSWESHILRLESVIREVTHD